MDQRYRTDLRISLAIFVMTAVVAGCTPKSGSQPPANPVSPPAVSQPIAPPEPTQPATVQLKPSPPESKQPWDEPYPSFTLRTISPGHWQIGPLGEQLTARFDWFNEQTLLFSPDRPYGSIIDLQQGRIVDPSPIPVPGMTISPYTAFSPDMRHVAYIRQGDLVIREIGSGLEKVWKTEASPDAYSCNLWWSPNGRYVVGSWGIFSGGPNTGKVWSLDWQTGEITRLFDEPNRLYYFDGQWSPDGDQIVLRGG